MATVDDLDSDISHLHARIATLQAHRANLSSVLLSQPHLSARLQTPNQNSKSSDTAQRAIEQQSKRNLENIYRACAGVTAYKVKDPDPNAINNGNILGVSIDVAIGGKFIETYHVLLNWRLRDDERRLLRIHKHTIPPCIPLQQLVNKWLPTSGKDVDTDPEQDLVRFGRLLRKELVSWHMRINAVQDMRREAGLSNRSFREDKDAGNEITGKVLNAFVSDDEASDVEEDAIEDGPVRILEVESDAAVRQVTVTWSDRRVAVMNVSKDGRVEKAVCRARDGIRDAAMSRKAVGPMVGLIRRLNA